MKHTTVKHLLSKLKFSDIEKAIQYHYPFIKSSRMKKHYKALMVKKTRKVKDQFLEVYMSEAFPEDSINDFCYSKTTMIHLLCNEKGELKPYSMSFISWERLVNTPLTEKTLKDYTPKDIVAHFIYEVSWYGTEKKIAVLRSKLKKSIEKQHHDRHFSR